MSTVSSSLNTHNHFSAGISSAGVSLVSEHVTPIALSPSAPYYKYYDSFFVQHLNSVNCNEVKFFFVHKHRFSLKTFIDIMISNLRERSSNTSDQELISEYTNKIIVLKEWRKCTLCSDLFARASSLLVPNSEGTGFKRAIFSSPYYRLLAAPHELQAAVNTLQKTVCSELVENYVSFGIIKESYSKAIPIYTGCETFGYYEHFTFAADMTTEIVRDGVGDISAMNRILEGYARQFLSNINTWSTHLNALECMASAYENKGSTAPGYSQYYTTIKWFKNVIKKNQYTNDSERFIFVYKEMITQMSTMRIVSNVIGMFAMFSPGGNLAECMNVDTPEKFWALMSERLNPTKYRVTTAPAKAGNVDGFISKYGEEHITQMFDRETWDITDPRLRKWMLYVRETPPANTLDASTLRNMARRKSTHTTNCFSNTSPVKTNYSMEEFGTFLSTVPSADKIEWLASAYYPITYAFPTHDVGRQYIEREGNWVLQTIVERPTANWCEVEAIGTHAGTWKNNYPEPYIEGGVNTGSHTSVLVNEGITIVPTKNNSEALRSKCNLKFNTNALFAEFFNGDFHEFRKIRGMYHDKTQINITTDKPYRGAFISRTTSSVGKQFQFEPQKFRINGVIYTVN